jgi:DNA-binding HxlR family transcriptional regulator
VPTSHRPIAERAQTVFRSEKCIEVLRHLSLLDGPAFHGDIQTATGIKTPTLSTALTTLLDVGLITTDMPDNQRVRGRAARYSAKRDAIDTFVTELHQYLTGR